MPISFTVNGTRHELDVEPEMPLLWALRDELGLTGTKFGCGVAACGACTVHVDGMAMRSCVTPVEMVDGSQITTIEGLAAVSGAAEGELSALQAAWVARQVPQCGYCQSGMLMAVSALLAENPQPTDEDIDAAITNVCRCGTYPRIRAAIRDVTSA
jgi:isoquinoline 1-oxidoreductase alpha subunit